MFISKLPLCGKIYHRAAYPSSEPSTLQLLHQAQSGPLQHAKTFSAKKRLRKSFRKKKKAAECQGPPNKGHEKALIHPLQCPKSHP